MDCAEPLPGVSAAGLNVQTACVGRFEHDSVTAPCKRAALRRGLDGVGRDVPAATVAASGDAPSVKFVTVIFTSCVDEKPRPLLLPLTFTLVVPNGQ